MITTKRDFLRHFREGVLPLIRRTYEADGRIDYPARREAWNNIIDAEVRDGSLPKRALDWVCPW